MVTSAKAPPAQYASLALGSSGAARIAHTSRAPAAPATHSSTGVHSPRAARAHNSLTTPQDELRRVGVRPERAVLPVLGQLQELPGAWACGCCGCCGATAAEGRGAAAAAPPRTAYPHGVSPLSPTPLENTPNRRCSPMRPRCAPWSTRTTSSACTARPWCATPAVLGRGQRGSWRGDLPASGRPAPGARSQAAAHPCLPAALRSSPATPPPPAQKRRVADKAVELQRQKTAATGGGDHGHGHH